MNTYFKSLCFFLLLSLPLTAGEFYVLLIGDTADEAIAKSVKYDLKEMTKEVKAIAKYSQQKLHLKVLKDAEVTIENIFAHLDQIQLKNDDTLFFYYNGHGFRTPWKSEPWPILFIQNSETGLHFETVNEILKNKNPRLLISFADVCNNVPQNLDDPVQIPEEFLRSKKREKTKQAKVAYKNLFALSHGRVIASSSKPEQASHAIIGWGCLFSVQFLSVMKEIKQGQTKGDWENIMNRVVRKTDRFAIKANLSQTPQYQIDKF